MELPDPMKIPFPIGFPVFESKFPQWILIEHGLVI